MRRMWTILMCLLLLCVAGCATQSPQVAPGPGGLPFAAAGDLKLVATEIRAAAALTTSYVATSTRTIDHANQLMLLVEFTKGSSTGCYLKVEFSEDKSTFFQESSISLASGVLTHTVYVRSITVAGNYVVAIPILGSFYKVSAKALTSGTNTSLTITEVVGQI